MSLCCVCFFCADAQLSHSRWKENFDVNDFRVKTIDLPAPGSKLLLQNINGISVIDARADTNRVGFMQKKVIDPFSVAMNNAIRNQEEQKINTRPTFVKLRNGVQHQSEQFVKDYLSFTCNDSLPSVLMVIKKLWLSDELNFDADTHSGGSFKGTDSRDSWTSGVDIKIEFYLKDKANYYPLYRYDSLISEPMTISEYASEFVADALRSSLQKMKQMDERISLVKGRKNFSIEEIGLHNQNEFNIPALTDTILKKGVYMTFDEFKNNNPSQTNFEVRKDKLTDNIYIKQPGGTDLAARDVWGYSDGENAFIKSANNFFTLQRAANAFYIFGAKSIKRTESGTSGAASYYSGGSGFAVPYYYTRSRTFVQLEPFQLDWSTGKLY